MADELTQVAGDSVRGGFFLISGTAVSTVVLAIASIFVARFLGPELYGQYVLAFVVPQILYLFADVAFTPQAIIKVTSNLHAKGETDRLARIVKYAFILRASIGLTIFMINYAFADLFALIILKRPDLTFYIRIASISVLFQAILGTATSAFVGLDKTEYHAIASNIQAIAKAIISVALVLVGLSVAGAVLGHVASYIVSAVAGSFLLFLILRQKQGSESTNRLGEDIKTQLRYGMPIFVSLVLTGFIPLYQNVILAMFTTDADIGNYKAATNFATLITVLSMPITTALLPAFSKLDSSSIHGLRKFFKLANKYTAMIILPITFLIIIFSSEIVYIVYGSMYQSAPSFLATYCLLYLLVGLGYLTLTSFFNGLGETKLTLKMSLITFITLVILSPLLTSVYGVVGLIIAFLLASAGGTLYGSHIARANFTMEFNANSVVKIYLVSMLSSLVPLALLQLSPFPKLLNLVAGALLYMFIYITLTPLTGIVNNPELQAAKNILQNIKPLAPIAKPLIKYESRILNHSKQP